MTTTKRSSDSTILRWSIRALFPTAFRKAACSTVCRLKRQTGGHRVFIFDHTIRRTPPEGAVVPDTPQSRQPVSRVHVDVRPPILVLEISR